MVLDGEPDLVVVGEAADGDTAVALAARTCCPDVVLMDVRMPRARRHRGDRRRCRDSRAERSSVVMLTISDEEADLFEAVKAGVTGYLLKEISIDEVPGRRPGRARRATR